MSELGLGFERGRQERRGKRRKQQQQRKLHSRNANLDRREHAAHETSPNTNRENPSSRAKEDYISVHEENEDEDEEILYSDNRSVARSLPVDLQGERIAEENEAPFPPIRSATHSPTGKLWNRRVNSEIHPLAINKKHFPRTISLDLNSPNAVVMTPQYFIGGLTSGKKSPWTPNYQKGWSSERVSLAVNCRRRYLCNGRALPSKWDDAERWIGSPVSVDETGRLALPSYCKRPKSKSGPLEPGSLLVPCFDSGRVVNTAANSPLLAGVLRTDQDCYDSTRGAPGECVGRRIITSNVESYIIQQAAAAHGWSGLSSHGTIQDEKIGSKESSIIHSPKVLQKDMATQMSPAGNPLTSSDKRTISSFPPSSDPFVEVENDSLKLEIRDVQVDSEATTIRQPKKHLPSDRCLRNIIDWRNKPKDEASTSEVAEPSAFLSKYDREEAKIRAWRNLQEAKAETDIRKLEMKLEKERSISMQKILDRLTSAQRKAEDRRNAARDRKPHQTQKTRRKVLFFGRSVQLCFLGSCFNCYAI